MCLMDQSLISELLTFFKYDPDCGVFYRAKDVVRSNGRSTHYKAGQRAGSLQKGRYRILQFESSIGRVLIYEHRAAFAFMGQEMPKMVDHINGNKSDNRWINLRASNNSDNQFNRHIKSGKSKDLPIGVYRCTRSGRHGNWYGVRIQKNGRTKSTYTRHLEKALEKEKQFREELWKA
jgi:hypothetical protein